VPWTSVNPLQVVLGDLGNSDAVVVVAIIIVHYRQHGEETYVNQTSKKRQE
jgi:hypothetical protein